jgi:outer membrane protein
MVFHGRRFVLLMACCLCSSLGGAAQSVQRLTLKDAEDIALKNHPQIQSARFSALAENQVTREAKSAYFPYASAGLTGAGAIPNSRIAAGYLNNPTILNRYSNGIAVGQLITDFGRTQNLVQSARLGAQASNETLLAKQADVLLQVNQAYFDALRTQAVLQVAQETVKDRQLVVDQVSALEKSKLKSGLDLSFAQVNLAQAQLLLVQAENDVKAADAQLSAALGFQDQRSFDLADEPLPDAPPEDVTPLVAEAFRQRPELAGERFTDESALRFAKAERDLWFPKIEAVGAAGLTPVHQAALADRYAAAGLTVDIPIFNGHLFSALRTEADLKAQAEHQNLRDLEDRVARDVRLAWLNARTGFQRLGLTQQLLNNANLALDLAQERYKLGLSSIVELSQAQLNETQAQIEQTSAKYDYQIQFATLNYQIGILH